MKVTKILRERGFTTEDAFGFELLLKVPSERVERWIERGYSFEKQVALAQAYIARLNREADMP